MAEGEASWPRWATEPVELVDYDPAWVRAGARECQDLQRLLEPWRVDDVEHVGSTAIPGLTAKPILDLQAPVADLAVADEVAVALAGHHWHYVPLRLDQRSDRRFFVKVADGHRAAHLHLLTADGDRWHDQLTFRNELRADPNLRDAYARLKASLAERYTDDREAYSDAKREFVDDVIRRAAG